MFNNDLQVSIVRVNSEIAHTCGNVSALMFDECKSHFPTNFFKYEHVNTRLAIKQFQNINKVVDFKKRKPIIAMQPKLIIDKPEYNVDMIRRLNGTNIYDMLRPDYHNVKFFKDSEKGLIIDFSVERMKMSFEFNFVVSTEYAQYNTSSHMANTFRFEHPYYYNEGRGALLEIVIPDCIIEQLSSDSGIPIKNKDNMVKDFLDYINTISNLPITYQLLSATGEYRFFMVVTTNILMTYSSFNVSDGVTEGLISDTYPITMQLDIEFNYPNVFFYLTKEPETPFIDRGGNQEVIATRGNVDLYYTFQTTIIPPRDSNNKEFYVSLAFTVEELPEDRIDIRSMFDPIQKEIIQYLELSDDTDVNDFINIRVYRDGNLLIKNKDFRVDWITNELIIIDANPKYTYRLACYTDNLIRNKYELKFKHKY